jgi:folate-binding protein YgfZ
MNIDQYNHIRSGGSGFIEMPRGLIAVWGKESVQFLDGLVSNDVKTLHDGQQMLAAFPNAQGRLLAIVRVLRKGDRFLIETEEETREKVFQNLFRFTYAGDFFAEEISGQYQYFEIFTRDRSQLEPLDRGIRFEGGRSLGIFVPAIQAEEFAEAFSAAGARELDKDTFEVLRIEAGLPLYGVDMDETTVVPELGLEGLISYNKGCYIGQEIIARIHFRGNVAKQLAGLLLEAGRDEVEGIAGSEVMTEDGKNAGRVTSAAYSATHERMIALSYIRHSFLEEGTELTLNGNRATVKNLPFVDDQC